MLINIANPFRTRVLGLTHNAHNINNVEKIIPEDATPNHISSATLISVVPLTHSSVEYWAEMMIPGTENGIAMTHPTTHITSAVRNCILLVISSLKSDGSFIGVGSSDCVYLNKVNL